MAAPCPAQHHEAEKGLLRPATSRRRWSRLTREPDGCVDLEHPCPRRQVGVVGFRFPPEVITFAVRWYLRATASRYRDVEELLAERGVEVDHVTVDRWSSMTDEGCWPVAVS